MSGTGKCEGQERVHSSPVYPMTVDGRRMDLCEICAKQLTGHDIKLRVEADRVTPPPVLKAIHRIRQAVLA